VPNCASWPQVDPWFLLTTAAPSASSGTTWSLLCGALACYCAGRTISALRASRLRVPCFSSS
jgi:hypothetical protein